MSKSTLAVAASLALALSLTDARAVDPGLATHLPSGATLVGGLDPGRLPAGSVLDPLTWDETPILRHAQEALDLLSAAGVDPATDVDTLAFGVFGDAGSEALSVLTSPLVVVALGRLDPAAMDAAAPPGIACREVAPATVLIGRESWVALPAAGHDGPEIPADAALWLSAEGRALGAAAHSAESLLFRDIGRVVAHVAPSGGAVTVLLEADAGSDAAAAERAAWTNSLLDLLRPLSLGRPGLEGAAGVEVTSSDASVVARLVLNEVQLSDLAETLRPFRASPPLAGRGGGLVRPERIDDEPVAAGHERGERRDTGRR